MNRLNMYLLIVAAATKLHIKGKHIKNLPAARFAGFEKGRMLRRYRSTLNGNGRMAEWPKAPTWNKLLNG